MYKTEDFSYFLPKELIAQTPVTPRDFSRLLIYGRREKSVGHKHFYNLPDLLNAGDVLVINNTKVIPARIFASTENGGKAELLLLTKLSQNKYEALVKPGRKALPDKILQINNELRARIVEKTESGGRIVEFMCERPFEELLYEVGTMPLPPYITRELKEQSRYQTVYSKFDGSSAAPTAGLHFTPELLQKLKDKGVIIAQILLHVGLGTFRPVKAENIADHKMHGEFYRIDKEAADIINLAKDEGRRIIAVGTTSVRTLESACDKDGKVAACEGKTDIFIYPPYEFKCVDSIITNFHLPQSTLIMLISAFMGKEQTLELYDLAVREKYRFFSFGDAMFIY